MRWRKIKEAELCEKTGIKPSELKDLKESGAGSLTTILAVLDYLGIVPLVLPPPDQMK